MNPIIICEWEDAFSKPNTDLDDMLKHDPVLVKTYGVLVHKSKKYYIIKTHDGGGDGCDDMLKIPTPLVRRVSKFKEG